MTTFLLGLAILLAGGWAYGHICERVFAPDDRCTPAAVKNDGVDYVPMKRWRNSMIQLLNIAGTGPILGPIQGILFGPIAFLLIPVGCVLGGAVHDYFIGMVAMRERGAQMPALVRKFLGGGFYTLYNVFLCLMMLLLGAVYIYTPGELLVTQLLDGTATADNPVLWVVFGALFIYYICATLFPIDKIIGKIYPIFGGILLLSGIGLFIGLLIGNYQLENISLSNWRGLYPGGTPLIPAFFITVSCGIVSGFHATQTTIISRTAKSERDGRRTFYNMMIAEGFLAMVWAAAAMGIYQKGLAVGVEGTPEVIGIVARDLLGPIGGVIAIIGIILLPITSGDTALRSVRLMSADFLRYDQKPRGNRLLLTAAIFLPVAGALALCVFKNRGFNILWNYFAWCNQVLALFTFSVITVYLMMRQRNYLVSLLPGTFYAFVVCCYILHAKIGLRLPMGMCYVISAVLTVAYVTATLRGGHRMLRNLRAEFVTCE